MKRVGSFMCVCCNDRVLSVFPQSAGDMATIHSATLETERYVRSQQFNSVR